ncbi:protein-glutamine gamma-glutamyltransferase E-like [Rhinatrema bivittatum]|uniref:protein-glutamine gamma-glutamyltransferase E-like n=1 Tax=Rhinatrema bivittatum TaxID=194408 RepID=UPI00112AB36C|nr:protein-glutamine gamma-glutamyltransferase E-like [Rhinatrema bivittatum]
MWNPKPTGINLQASLNKRAHHTDRYISKALIVRRGQPFSIIIDFDRSISGEKITFTAQTGPSPSEAMKTKTVFPLSRTRNKGSWSAVSLVPSSRSLKIDLTSPVNAIIGHYKISFQIASMCSVTSHSLADIILLFNPWTPGDEVYMADNAHRQEYVLNDFGIIYNGTKDYIRGSGWSYGQFDENVLTTCLAILDRSVNYKRDRTKDISSRNDPIYVSRVCSAVVNCNNEDGVLWGKWKEPYSNGQRPNYWNGSVAILRQWYNNNFQSVKYGQCWVFGGVLCTVLRCLGIPARTVTNFDSAHDTNVNLAIDKYFDVYGSPQSSPDSIWNFHVWNEGWFVRKDLGSQYKGWQVLDATPQEPSEGLSQCGPTSVNAIKEGDVHLKCDTPFVFAEVNADVVNWICSKDGRKKRIACDTSRVGKFISTKAVGQNIREDITANYKYPEGSAKEREIYNKACNKLFRRKPLEESSEEELEEDLLDDLSDDCEEHRSEPEICAQFKLANPPVLGQDINFKMMLKNKISEAKTIRMNQKAFSIEYTGQAVKEILKSNSSVALGANEEKQISLTIPYSQYDNLLTEDNMILLVAVCEDDQGKQILVQRSIVVESPPIVIKAPDQVTVKKTVKMEVAFDNPLTEEVKDCTLVVEGSGLVKEPLKINVGNLKPKEKAKIPFEITPYTCGTQQLLVGLVCEKFSEVKNFQSIAVVKAQ